MDEPLEQDNDDILAAGFLTTQSLFALQNHYPALPPEPFTIPHRFAM